MAKPSADDTTLLNVLQYACSMTGCKSLEKNNPCFIPDNLISHASVAMNLYYQAMGRNNWNCFFNGTGLIVITDPSKLPTQTSWISFLLPVSEVGDVFYWSRICFRLSYDQVMVGAAMSKNDSVLRRVPCMRFKFLFILWLGAKVLKNFSCN